ncbi:hypothetical protein HD554DRAFT_1413270 [Boletus coccyginus]|nr:hypothetical protein HD554DRAFT_1413270 [Boletus coccyginus]
MMVSKCSLLQMAEVRLHNCSPPSSAFPLLTLWIRADSHRTRLSARSLWRASGSTILLARTCLSPSASMSSSPRAGPQPWLALPVPENQLYSLIERFYDPLGSSIKLDGVDPRDFNIKWLRSQIGCLPGAYAFRDDHQTQRRTRFDQHPLRASLRGSSSRKHVSKPTQMLIFMAILWHDVDKRENSTSSLTTNLSNNPQMVKEREQLSH